MYTTVLTLCVCCIGAHRLVRIAASLLGCVYTAPMSNVPIWNHWRRLVLPVKHSERCETSFYPHTTKTTNSRSNWIHRFTKTKKKNKIFTKWFLFWQFCCNESNISVSGVFDGNSRKLPKRLIHIPHTNQTFFKRKNWIVFFNSSYIDSGTFLAFALYANRWCFFIILSYFFRCVLCCVSVLISNIFLAPHKMFQRN